LKCGGGEAKARKVFLDFLQVVAKLNEALAG
jgi:hypothetical protein